MRPGWTASPLDPEYRRLKIGAQLGTIKHAEAWSGLNRRCLPFHGRQSIESKAEGGKNITFRSAPRQSQRDRRSGPSADGSIARLDGDVSWLDRPQPKRHYGMGAFMKSIDTILGGRKTHTKGIEMGMKDGGFGPKIKNYLFSRQPQRSLLPGFELKRPDQAIRATLAVAAR